MIFFLIASLADVYEKAVLENYSAKTLRYFTVICRRENDGDRLIKVCKELEKKYPEAEEIKISLAQGYLIKKQNKKGIKILKEIVKNSSYPERTIIGILMDFQLYSEAEKFIKLYRKKFRTEYIMNEEAGWIYEQKKQYEKAIKEYIKLYNHRKNPYYIKRIEKLIPYIKNIKILDDIKNDYYRERLELIFIVEKKSLSNIKDQELIKKAGEILFEKKEYQKAIELFKRINDSLKIGKIYIAEKNFKKARKYIKEGYELALIYANLYNIENKTEYKDSLNNLLNKTKINCSKKMKLYFLVDDYKEIQKIYHDCDENDTTSYIYLLTLFAEKKYDIFPSYALDFLKKYQKSNLKNKVYMLYLASLNEEETDIIKRFAIYDFKENYKKLIEESNKIEVKDVIVFSFIIEAFIKLQKYNEALTLINKIKKDAEETTLKQLLLFEEIKIRYTIHQQDPAIKRLYDEIMILNPKSPYAHFAREYIE